MLELLGPLAVAAYGLKIEQFRVRISSPRENVVSLESEVTAQKAFFRGGVRLSGEVQLTPIFELQFHNLSCQGNGALGKLAAPLLEKAIGKHQGTSYRVLGHWFPDTSLG